jgi:hypothetical protein
MLQKFSMHNVIYGSITEASKALGITPAHIGHVLHKRSKHAKGFSFEYI